MEVSNHPHTASIIKSRQSLRSTSIPRPQRRKNPQLLGGQPLDFRFRFRSHRIRHPRLPRSSSQPPVSDRLMEVSNHPHTASVIKSRQSLRSASIPCLKRRKNAELLGGEFVDAQAPLLSQSPRYTRSTRNRIGLHAVCTEPPPGYCRPVAHRHYAVVLSERERR